MLRTLLLLLVFAGLAAINIRGVKSGVRAVGTVTIAKLIPLLVFIGIGVFFNAGLLAFALYTTRLREAKGEVLIERDFHPFQRVTDWTRERAAKRDKATATVRRAKRARERTRSTPRGATTGEWRRPDAHRTQSSDDIHRTQFPNRDTVIK